MNTPHDTDFVGWYRPHSRSPWRPVCHGPSEYVVLGKLLDAVKGGDKAVLPRNTDPNNDRQSTLRRRF